jgi:hypothetical protein
MLLEYLSLGIGEGLGKPLAVEMMEICYVDPKQWMFYFCSNNEINRRVCLIAYGISAKSSEFSYQSNRIFISVIMECAYLKVCQITDIPERKA